MRDGQLRVVPSVLHRYHMQANALGIDWWDWMTELDKRRNKVPRSSPPLKLPDSPSPLLLILAE